MGLLVRENRQAIILGNMNDMNIDALRLCSEMCGKAKRKDA